MNKRPRPRGRFQLVVAAGAVLVVVVCLVAVPILWRWLGGKDAAAFGDAYGVANALFSGLAFAAFLYALGLQREELKLQRQELAQTRKELQRSAEAQEAQLQEIRAQREQVKHAELLALTPRVQNASPLPYVFEHEPPATLKAIIKNRGATLEAVQFLATERWRVACDHSHDWREGETLVLRFTGRGKDEDQPVEFGLRFRLPDGRVLLSAVVSHDVGFSVGCPQIEAYQLSPAIEPVLWGPPMDLPD